MNILFISFDADPPNKGGTATVVHILAKYFVSKGHYVALAYLNKSNTPSTFFKEKIYLSRENEEQSIRNFFVKHQFDVVYNVFGIDTDWDLLNKYKGKAIVISAYHNQPRLLRYPHIRSRLLSVLNSTGFTCLIKNVIFLALTPIQIILAIQSTKKRWIKMAENSDKILLLSDNYRQRVKKILPDISDKSIISISNPTVFDKAISIDEIENKKKILLVVTSMNYQKRGLAMIKIWRKIQSDSSLSEWTFRYVGDDGNSLRFYKWLVKFWKLKNIEFYPKQNPYPFYQNASIFMMTSRYEGWPMVLLESMQMGVIPIVFNSFEAVTDIIKNGVNGIIVRDNDIDEYVRQLKRLMHNDKLRYDMALECLDKVNSCNIDAIGHIYLENFENAIRNK